MPETQSNAWNSEQGTVSDTATVSSKHTNQIIKLKTKFYLNTWILKTSERDNVEVFTHSLFCIMYTVLLGSCSHKAAQCTVADSERFDFKHAVD